jgi:hypothetical protein
MKRQLDGFFTSFVAGGLIVATLQSGGSDLLLVALTAIVVPWAVLAGVRKRDGYGQRFPVALAIMFLAGVSATPLVTELLTGPVTFLVLFATFFALVYPTILVVNRLPVDGERFPEHGRYWGTPWEDRATIQGQSEE